jgi:type I restriction-modification system DNA methylase subunit
MAIHGQEKVAATVALCRMNLAMLGLEGDIKEAITYYDDLHNSTGKFDFVLTNPPFNVNAVGKERLEADVGKGRRYPFGLPPMDNANYFWILLFYSTLNQTGVGQVSYFPVVISMLPPVAHLGARESRSFTRRLPRLSRSSTVAQEYR